MQEAERLGVDTAWSAEAWGADAATSLAFLDGLPPGSIPSMHRDIAAGRPSELEQLSGAVVRLGRECGVATPVHQFIHAALLPAELAARGTVPPAVDPRSEGSSSATAA